MESTAWQPPKENIRHVVAPITHGGVGCNVRGLRGRLHEAGDADRTARWERRQQLQAELGNLLFEIHLRKEWLDEMEQIAARPRVAGVTADFIRQRYSLLERILELEVKADEIAENCRSLRLR